MSEERVELARRLFEALNRGDVSGAMKGLTADFVFRLLAFHQPGTGRVQTRRRSFLEAFTGIWDSVRYEPEFVEAGDQLVTPITTYNRGRDGIEVRTQTAWLWSFSDRGIERIIFFQARRDALEAAGLSE